MRNETSTSTRQSDTPAVRKPWTAPRVQELPRLTELTLLTGPGIPGDGEIDGGGGGSTVFA